MGNSACHGGLSHERGTAVDKPTWHAERLSRFISDRNSIFRISCGTICTTSRILYTTWGTGMCHTLLHDARRNSFRTLRHVRLWHDLHRCLDFVSVWRSNLTMREGIRSCESNSPRRMKRLLLSVPTVDTLQKLQKKSLNLKTSHVAKHLPRGRQKPALRPRTAELSLYCICLKAQSHRVHEDFTSALQGVEHHFDIFGYPTEVFWARWALVG